MWLYVPCQSAPAKPDSNSESNCPASKLSRSVTWRGKSTPSQILRGLSRKESWRTLLPGLTCEQSAMQSSALSWPGGKSTLSAEDTPASRSAVRVSDAVRTILDTFGLQSLTRLASTSPHSVFSRTCRAISPLGLKPSSMIYGEWVTKLRLDSLARRKSAQATSESGCSSWPTAKNARGTYTRDNGDPDKQRPTLRGLAEKNWHTPTTPDRGPETAESKATRTNGGIDLQTQAKLWPTPAAEEAKKSDVNIRGNPTLKGSATQWPTPAGRDHKGANAEKHLAVGTGRKHLDQLPNFVSHCFRRDQTTGPDGAKSPEAAPTLPRRLNPTFVSWLMGFPLGWANIAITGSGFMATQLSRFRRRMRSRLLWLVCTTQKGGLIE